METVTLGNRTVFYRQYGRHVNAERPPLVLIHGAGGNHLIWPPQIRHLPETAVYAIDLPGHGESSGPACASISAYSEVVRDVVDALELPWFVLAGHSMGGAIALDFALAYAQRLAGIVVAGAGARLRVSQMIIDTTLHEFPKATEFIVEHSYTATTPEAEKAVYLHHLREVDPQVLYMDFVACHNFDVTDRVSELELPSLIICGADDQMTPPRLSTQLNQLITGSELLIIDGAGHNVMLEQPAEVARHMGCFIDRWN
ncbi:MAG: alpha/beta hydrolase [Anaerolineales bacterium]|nr:alpha/beta hydrolase [Anaerolineales bacterium]